MYMFLLVGCCLVTLYPVFSPLTMAFIALLWGLLAAGMTLWMLERVQDYKKNATPPPRGGHLPESLIYKMRRQNSYSRGVRSTKAYSMHNFYLLIALLMFAAWGVGITLNPVTPPALLDLNDQILSVFRMSDGFDPASYSFISVSDVLLRNTMPLLVLVLAFWLGQVFAYSTRAAEVLVWLCFSLFVMVSTLLFVFAAPINKPFPVDIWDGYGWGRSAVLQALEIIPSGDISALQRRLYALGMPGAILAYLPGVMMALVLLRNAFTKASPKIKVLAGFAVLCALLAADMFYPSGAAAFGLNLAGWSALAFLSIRGRTDVRKTYRLYQ